MMQIVRLFPAVCMAALAACGANPPASVPGADARSEDRVRQLARALATDLAAECPPALPGDTSAFDRCRRFLFDESRFRQSLKPFVLWGRQHREPGTPLKDTQLTQFAPDVLSGMYIPLFMFNGRHTVEFDATEGLWVIRLETAFRNHLPLGQFPYPFWHSDAKWATYQRANGMLFWIDPQTTRVKVAQFTDRASGPPVVASTPVAAPKFDKRWMWTDASGRTQPQVTLFDGVFRSDNPYLPKLEPAYRDLALKMRDAQCDTCHVPDNPHGMKRLVLLQTPAHAAGEIQRLMKSVREDKMPLDEAGIEQPLEPQVKAALLESGGAFEALVRAARAWEAERRAR